MSNVFTVTRVSKLNSNNTPATASLLGDRTDLKMASQRRAALRDARQRLQVALLKDYSGTVATRHTHHVFLGMMLGEVYRHNMRHHDGNSSSSSVSPNVSSPATTYSFSARALKRSLAGLYEDTVLPEMAKKDADNYCLCLNAFSSRRLYSAVFFRECFETQVIAAPAAATTSPLLSCQGGGAGCFLGTSQGAGAQEQEQDEVSSEDSLGLSNDSLETM